MVLKFVNILLTCAGRRNYLVKYFQEALGDQGQVFTGDASCTAPAMQESDKAFVLPPVNQKDYIDVLLNICIEHRVNLLISLNDLELPGLAKERERFLENDIFPVISSPQVVDICFDKWQTVGFLKKCHLLTPKTYLSLQDVHCALKGGEISYPLIVKPRWGSASIGLEYIENNEELELAYRLTLRRIEKSILAGPSLSDPARSVLIQEVICGQEYGFDIVNDLHGQYVTTFVKRKLSMRAGETDRAATVDNEQLVAVGETIGRQLGHIGNLDCDVFVSETRAYVLEMNPRFGGGYPFSHVAGADLPSAILAWANNKVPDPRWLKVEPNVTSSKCDRLVIVK